MKLSEKQTQILGWIATCMSVAMYVAYIPQIMNNLAGHKGDFIQPLVAALNCSLWVYYGLFKPDQRRYQVRLQLLVEYHGLV